MDFIDEKINIYSELHSSPESEILKNLNRETHANVLMPRMLSGHLQGRMLSMISCMIQPLSILEIGTYTGYSALCLAEGLKDNGLIHTIDINDELTPMVRKYVSLAGLDSKFRIYTGNALDIIPTLNGPFDLVFIDADKINYTNYFDLVFDKVNKGGYILADNVLWSGKIIAPLSEMDKDTLALHQFNERIAHDNRLEKVLLPVRDGVMVMRKVKSEK
ncbi:MAG: class I SAM-dependent methyltransferase [Bacteroidetes bacterium]|nr:class I SAM-dependent methyltransferase [Bacteroidota bacterium]MBK9413445.1 class I SAM-dependent methyltransferase [Bacteroidota bacterium]MBL0032603.1 class I SAM-dependent methyltransferase [Bacteroidota bacterium]MBP6428078.1 class I SAM-dependent methyltransferase [Bacteroidia bacterium]MBP6657800.1 class I SAM-dependent methyltransferase [Bacteroidia bacterium]